MLHSDSEERAKLGLSSRRNGLNESTGLADYSAVMTQTSISSRDIAETRKKVGLCRLLRRHGVTCSYTNTYVGTLICSDYSAVMT
jgi:hypothetical protein